MLNRDPLSETPATFFVSPPKAGVQFFRALDSRLKIAGMTGNDFHILVTAIHPRADKAVTPKCYFQLHRLIGDLLLDPGGRHRFGTFNWRTNCPVHDKL
jgi:hypothetical protein